MSNATRAGRDPIDFLKQVFNGYTHHIIHYIASQSVVYITLAMIIRWELICDYD